MVVLFAAVRRGDERTVDGAALPRPPPSSWLFLVDDKLIGLLLLFDDSFIFPFFVGCHCLGVNNSFGGSDK